MSSKSRFRWRLLGGLCLGLIFFFLGRELWSNWTALKAYSWRLNPALALCSFFTMTSSLFLLPWGLQEVLALLGHRLSYRRISRILFTSLMAKYLPGGWWAFVGRAHFYGQEGMSLPQASVAILLETILVVISGISVFALFFFQLPRVHLGNGEKIIFSVLAAGCLISWHPFVLNLFLSWAGKLCKKPVIPLQYSYWKIAYPFTIFFLFWLGMGGSFCLLAGSLLRVELAWLPQMVGAFAFSWVLGFLSFVTPGGLGVREGVLTFLLAPPFPVYAAAALALLSRVWWIGGEILALLLCFLWERIPRRRPEAFPRAKELEALPAAPAEKGNWLA